MNRLLVRLLIGAPLISTVFQGSAFASDFISAFFSDEQLKAIMARDQNVHTKSITKADISEVRRGACESWRQYNDYPSDQFKDFCVKLQDDTGRSQSHSINAQITGNNSAIKINNSAHNKCLDARDYKGCMSSQTKAIEADASKRCKVGEWCMPTSGTDILGYPIIEGWEVKQSPEKMTVWYRKTVPFKVNVRGETNRYFAIEGIARYWSAGYAGTAPTTTTIAPARTNCFGYGSSLSCRTTPAVTTSSPGSPGMPAGVTQFYFHYVIDCKDRTMGWHVNGRLRGNWNSLDKLHSKTADDFCPVIDTLDTSSLSIYKK